MKTAYKLTIVSSLLLAAGCSACHERHAKNEQNNEQFSNFQPSTTQNTTSGTSTAATPQTQAFGQTGGQNEVVTQVQKQLTQDPSLAPLVPSLQISFQNGTVILAGNVPSEQEKNKIETIVKSTTGVANVNNQLQVSSQSQVNLPGATENKQAVGGTSEQSTISQSTGTQSSQPAAPAPSANEQTAQPPSAAPGQQPPDQSLIGQNQSSTTQEQKPQDQNLSPTADQKSTSRIYNTNQSSSGTSDSLGKAAGENVNVKIQAATEADRTLGQQVVQELRTDN